jgi:hypothetical protein
LSYSVADAEGIASNTARVTITVEDVLGGDEVDVAGVAPAMQGGGAVPGSELSTLVMEGVDNVV